MKSTITCLILLMVGSTTSAQMFESQCTKYTGKVITKRLKNLGSAKQISLRDSVIASRKDSVETFFDGENLGLIVYKNNGPWELLGFWDKDVNPIAGGSLHNGTGTITTPLPAKRKDFFKQETVPYVNGQKTGQCFYFCDCKHIFAEGYYQNDSKQGEWNHYEISGALIPKKEKIKVDRKDLEREIIRNVGHCMMRVNNPDVEKIKPDHKHD